MLRSSFVMRSDTYLGSVTRAQAWNRLKTEGRIETEQFIPMVNHPRRTILESKLSDLKPDSWGFELDMYPHIMKAIKEGLYEQMEDVLVVDTHQHNDFHADISVAEHDDGRLLYSLRYFLELKHPKVEPQTAEYCGQVLDYFHVVREKQPHRSRFVALLSNFSWTWAYVADYDTNGTKIHEYPCRTLADAVIYAETTSISQLKTTLPTLDGMLEPKFSVLAVGKHSFLLSVTKSPEVGVLTRTSSRRQTVKSVYCWKPPVRHRETKNHLKFVLKIMHDDSSLANEIKILKTFRDAACSHLPELVWTREGNKELGIAPIGEPVRPGESAAISRKIVRGMIEGLRYLHNLHIIHRDIRLSNLILKRTANDVNVVIIDYETAFAFDQGPREVEYAGGYICWPTRLLQTGTKLYVPSPADDLFASVLVVLHLLFPSRFDEFNAGEIQSDDEANQETLRILQTWKDIESSSVWGQFYQAARNEEYDNLLRMSDFFCHV